MRGPGGSSWSAGVCACVCVAAAVGQSTETSRLFPTQLASDVSQGEGSEAETEGRHHELIANFPLEFIRFPV